jgi:hypothetical protein
MDHAMHEALGDDDLAKQTTKWKKTMKKMGTRTINSLAHTMDIVKVGLKILSSSHV